jgi:hypothetical protein
VTASGQTRQIVCERLSRAAYGAGEREVDVRGCEVIIWKSRLELGIRETRIVNGVRAIGQDIVPYLCFSEQERWPNMAKTLRLSSPALGPIDNSSKAARTRKAGQRLLGVEAVYELVK